MNSVALKSIRTGLTALVARTNWIFYVSVALPTAIALLYSAALSSDVYISESRFVLRSQQPQVQESVIGAILQGTAFGRAQDDTYSVRDFILSRDALRTLQSAIDFRSLYSKQTINFIDRFPGIAWNESFEGLYKYYQKHVTVDYDPVSSISVLSVRAYSPEDARRINDLLLNAAEALVNQLNERGRNDLIQVATKEVEAATERTTDAAIALSAYRNRQAVVEPEKQSMLQLESVGKLKEELILLKAQLEQVKQISPTNPQLGSLKGSVDNLQKTIDAETGKVTGNNGSLTSKAMNYERLALQKDFAEKQLALALANLESAKSEAQRKRLYLERLVQPNLPDYALEPHRLRLVVTTFVFGLITWGLLSLIVASIEEHGD